VSVALDRRRIAVAGVGAVALISVGLVVWALPDAVRFAMTAPNEFWAIAALALVVDVPLRGAVPGTGAHVRSTLSPCFTLAIFALWGTAPAIVVQAVAAAVTSAFQRHGILGRGVLGGVFLASRLVCALAVDGLVVQHTIAHPVAATAAALPGHELVPFLILAAVWFVVSFGLSALAGATISRGGLRGTLGALRGELLATAALMPLVAPLLTTIPGWWSVLVALPLLAWNQLSSDRSRRVERLLRDPVTGLLNLAGLREVMGGLTLYDPVRPGRPRPVAVVVVDVESVLEVSRTLGRDLYEKLVVEGAKRLARAVGQGWVGRLSDEGFVVLLPGITDPVALDAAYEVAMVLQPTIVVDEIPFDLDPVAGAALSPEDGRDLDVLIVKAEHMVEEARRTGRRSAVYVKRTEELVQRRVAILADLYAALGDPQRHAELLVAYQPQVELSTGRLAGAEALMRWIHPVWGPMRPDEVIEAVESSKVMRMLTQHMLDRVGQQLRAWNEHGFRLTIAVNVSVNDMQDPAFPAEIAAVLRRHRIQPNQLTIEITERILADGSSRLAGSIGEIAGLGVGLSLDDFGTGHASMQQLLALPLTEVKIDKSYVMGMTGNATKHAIVTSIHQLASTLGLSVVAEGVEDARTAAALARLPGTIGQGWHFGRPVLSDDFEKQWRNRP
jgi:EAL domain-containing protein (putative c-di-GMP-specific phosphodiesterase class I)/GGDEF domain-containing protein